jgi:hypothetical protein
MIGPRMEQFQKCARRLVWHSLGLLLLLPLLAGGACCCKTAEGTPATETSCTCGTAVEQTYRPSCIACFPVKYIGRHVQPLKTFAYRDSSASGRFPTPSELCAALCRFLR